MDEDAGLRVPGVWNVFELATLGVLGQGISAPGAIDVAAKLAHTFGQPINDAPRLARVFPKPEILANAELSRVGVTNTQAQTLFEALARAVCAGTIRTELISDTEDLVQRLQAIPGLNRSTAQYVTMRALRDPDALPCADHRIALALGLNNSDELERHADSWRPWRSYAAMYLWKQTQSAISGLRH